MEESEGVAIFETLIPLVGLVVVVALGVILMVFQFQRSLFRQRLQQENLKTQHQEDLLRSAIAVQEEERQRISRDLHDELGARLSVSLMLLKQLRDPLTPGKPTPEQLQKLEEHLETALSSSKRISYELMPPQLMNLGLFQALLVLVEDARQAGQIQIDFRKSGEPDQLPWAVRIGLYRIVAELLNNTLKHAQATAVKLEVHVDQHQVSCTYEDNGRGLADVQVGQGQGLLNLKGRVKALQGILTLGTETADGFRAEINLPLAQESNG